MLLIMGKCSPYPVRSRFLSFLPRNNYVYSQCCVDWAYWDMSNVVAKTLDDLRQRGGLKSVDVANIAHVSKGTISRWSSGRNAPQLRMQLVLSDLRYVVDRLSEFYSPDEIRVWLNSRNDLLGGQRAVDLIHAHDTEAVLEAIERLGDTAYL